jgi:hypothetical protein
MRNKEISPLLLLNRELPGKARMGGKGKGSEKGGTGEKVGKPGPPKFHASSLTNFCTVALR